MLDKNKKEKFDLHSRIIATYELFEDDEVSTERLIAMVADACECETDDVINALITSGEET